MSQRDEHWEPEDEEVAGRLRAGRPRLTEFELDRLKTTVMARVRRPARRGTAPRSRLLVAVITVGLMAVGTAGTIAGGNTSFSGGTGAAQSQYRPPKCNPWHEECKCPGGSIRISRDRCVCPKGQTFAEGTNDCRSPDGSKDTDEGQGSKDTDDGQRETSTSSQQASSPPTQQSSSPSGSTAQQRRAHRQRRHH